MSKPSKGNVTTTKRVAEFAKSGPRSLGRKRERIIQGAPRRYSAEFCDGALQLNESVYPMPSRRAAADMVNTVKQFHHIHSVGVNDNGAPVQKNFDRCNCQVVGSR